MSGNKPICSLYILNSKNVTRSIARSILGPKKGGLIHFQAINQLNYALNLEKENEIEIKTAIPSHILSQLTGKKEESKVSPDVETSNEKTNSVKEEVVIQTDEVKQEQTEDKLQDVPNKLPEWYLTYQEVEGMTKQELLKWAEAVEELKIPKSKNAGEITAIVHKFLAQYSDNHVE
jgi:hypothetical protein